ncbi:hypothetical protein [Planomonospora venezuelensis]|uniref:Uncharacterized protein n=1 Tax=Planomonospora venezuelensis TaxID=1999 RepID=A0A841DC55_PLAVE|nr:hypothetical protein [Planomonospora venezuelensis]MBB5967069.1 hypothetical protein [Planomonospora venezuelensis]GIN04909.1 hypothetical protein Pve01_65670 [Planomonospora venezuelensis]
MSTTVRAEGAGAIAIGGDAINSIFVTGGANQFFIGQYERLVEAYLNPRALYRELRLDQFTGRAWLLRAIDDFLATNDRGYLVIEAEAGMGKTAFMAWLARERRYVHHFVRLMPDANDVGVALRNMAAQLIRAWDLQPMAVGGVLPASASRPDFFEEVVYEAAGKRDEIRPGEPIVIVVDGLNETAAPPGRNPLALPVELPEGVYVVVSQRTVHIPLAVATPRRVLRIRAGSPENLADLRAYLETAVTEPALAARLADAGVAPQDLVRQLVTRSAGVWLVLRYVLAELRNGTRTPDDLGSLPVGLWHYYARFWSEWQRTHEDTWPEMDLPLLVTLTAVQEPLTLDALCRLSGFPDSERAARLVGDAWRPFLQVEEGTQERYAAFHDSLGEFVAGKIDSSALTSAERPFVARLSAAQREAHDRIAERYLTAWGGLEGGLPGLRGEVADMDGGYGLRHVVHHLAAAGADAVLHRLMELEWPREEAVDPVDASPAANAWYEVHRARRTFAGYALDVRRAWARAERSGTLALELRYALVAASVNSMAGNVPSELLLLLVDNGVATAGQALELARGITEPQARAEALTALLPVLTGETRAETVREALASVQLVPDGYWRAGELVRLAPAAGPDHRDDLLRIATGLSRDYDRSISLRFLSAEPERRTTEPVPTAFSFDPADPQVFAAQYLQRTRRGVATLLQGIGADPGEETSAHRHVAASRFVRDPRWRAELLTASAHTAPSDARGDILRAALSISLMAGDRDALNAALASVAARLAAAGDVPAALACISEIRDPEGLTRALFAVSAQAPPPQRAEITRRAAGTAGRIADPAVRGQILRQHAAQLEGDLDDLLGSLGADWRASVWAAMGERNHDEDLLAKALSTAVAATEPGRARVIAELIPHLPSPLLATAHAAVGALEDPEQRDHGMTVLAARMGGLARLGDLDGIVSSISDAHWLTEALYRAGCGLAAAGQDGPAALIAARIASPPHRAEVLARAGRPAEAFAVADGSADPGERIAVLLRIGETGDQDRDGIAHARTALADVGDPVLLAPLANAVSLALAESGRPEAALDVVRMLPEEKRAAALAPLAPYAGDAVGEAAGLARTLRDPVSRARVLAGLMGPLVASGAPDIQGHLRETLRTLATGTRAQLLEAVPDLLPGLVEAAGLQGLADLGAAITSAHRWWP